MVTSVFPKIVMTDSLMLDEHYCGKLKLGFKKKNWLVNNGVMASEAS